MSNSGYCASEHTVAVPTEFNAFFLLLLSYYPKIKRLYFSLANKYISPAINHSFVMLTVYSFFDIESGKN